VRLSDFREASCRSVVPCMTDLCISISLPFLDLADMQQDLEDGRTRRRKTNHVVMFEVKSQWGAMQHCKNHAATTLNWRIYSLSAK
jgi:hypothetical protein